MTLAEISFSDSFQKTFDQLAEFIPKLIGAIVIFVIGWIIAKFLKKIIYKGLKAIGVDKLADKSGMSVHLERAGLGDAAMLLARIIYIGLMLIVLQLTVDALDVEAITDVLDDIIAFIPRVFVALLIVFLAGAIANFVREFVGGMTAEQPWGNFATNVATAGVWVIGAFAALDQLKIAEDIVDTLFTALVGSLALIFVIQFGVGGIWAARDRFWPAVYDKLSSVSEDTSKQS